MTLVSPAVETSTTAGSVIGAGSCAWDWTEQTLNNKAAKNVEEVFMVPPKLLTRGEDQSNTVARVPANALKPVSTGSECIPKMGEDSALRRVSP